MTMDPAERAAQIFDRHAVPYAARYDDVTRYASSLDCFLERMPPSARVLELACGPGNVTRYLLDRRPDLTLLGTDLAPNMLAIARERLPMATFARMDQRAMRTLGQRFHGIVCAFGLPYLSVGEAATVLADAAAVLHPGGALYLSTMEEPVARSEWEGPSEHERILMNYHAGPDLTRLLLDAGLRVTHESRSRYVNARGGDVTDLMLVAVLAS